MQPHILPPKKEVLRPCISHPQAPLDLAFMALHYATAVAAQRNRGFTRCVSISSKEMRTIYIYSSRRCIFISKKNPSFPNHISILHYITIQLYRNLEFEGYLKVFFWTLVDVSIAQRFHSFMPSSFIPFCRVESNRKTKFANSALFESFE